MANPNIKVIEDMVAKGIDIVHKSDLPMGDKTVLAYLIGVAHGACKRLAELEEEGE